MKSYEVYTYRRIALRWTREILAERAGIQVEYVRFFEEGKRIGSDFEAKIKAAINQGFKDLDEIEHYKARIMEIAYEVRFDDNVKEILQRTSHLMVETGKLQRRLVDSVTITSDEEDWED